MSEIRLFTLGNSSWFAQLKYTDKAPQLCLLHYYTMCLTLSMDTQLIDYLLSVVSSQHTTWGLDVCTGAVFWLSDWLP